MAEDPQQRITRITAIYVACMYSVEVYDWLTSLRREYKLVWRSSFSSITALYAATRYWGLFKFGIDVYLTSSNLTFEQCSRWAPFQVYGNVPVFLCSSILLALRIWALYERSKVVLITLLSVLAGFIVTFCIAAKDFGPPHYADNAPGFCFAVPMVQNKMLDLLWLLPFLFDVICTLLLVARVFVMRRRGAVQGGILSVLLRDGIVYFGVISSVNLINVVFFNLPPSFDFQSVNSGCAYIVTNVACCRLILSLREHAANEGISHTTTHKTGFNTQKNQAMSALNGGTTRVRDPEIVVNFDEEERRIEMVPVHTLGINVGVERSIKISDEEADKDLDEKEFRLGRNGAAF